MRNTKGFHFKKKLTLALILTCSMFWLSAQVMMPKNLAIIQPSAEAVSLNKYIDQPTGNYSGVPNISIPVYDINVSGLIVPISLSYHAGGINVNENASCVGLGWSLNAGGMISRTLQGLPDESSSGYLRSQPIVPYNCPASGQDLNKTIEYANGFEDSEPDLFYLNANGMNSKFYIDKSDQKAHLVNHRNLRIKHPFNLPNSSNKWEVTDEQGVRYFFDEVMTKRAVPISQRTDASSGSAGQWTNTFPSSWVLTKMLLPNSSDSVVFEYEDYNVNYLGSQQIMDLFGVPGPGQPGPISRTISQNRFFEGNKLIKKISFGEGVIHFIYSNPQNSDGFFRCDLSGGKYLKEVRIEKLDQAVVKIYKFSYSYFSSVAGTLPLSSQCYQLNEGELRLKLDSIIEESNGAILPPIKFVYNIEHPLPSRTEANGRDFWGYYNGEVIDPLPKVDGLIRNRGDVQCFPPGSYSEWFDASSVFVGSTKQPVLSYCKSATLERILYPTGGYVQYNFELHECESKELFDNTIEHKNRVVSGSELETPFSIEYSKVAKNDLTRMAHADLGQLDVKNIHIPDRSRLLITVKDSLGQKIGEVLLKSHMPDQNANQYVIEPSSYSFSNLPESFTVLSSLVDPGSGITDLASPLFSLSWVSETERKKKNVGGLRVKSILRGNASDDIVSKTDFKYVNIDTTRSSGILRAVPSYGYFTITLSSINFPILCFARSSASVNESNISSGSPVGYERVMMIEGGGDGPDQVSEFIFSTYKDYPDLFHSSTYGVPSSYVGLESPHLPNMDNEWRRGRLLKRKLFLTKPGGILNLLSEETNTYQDFSSSGVFEDSISPSSKAILIGRALAHAGNRYSYNVYPVYLGNYGFLSKKVVKLFAKEGADSISTTIKHFYNKQLGIMRIEEESSNSNLHVKSFVYPSDMLNHDPFGIYQKMVENHLLSSKIISMSYLNGNAFKEKEMITYSLFNSGDQILPAKIEKYDAQGNIINSVEYQKYDERGNLLQEKTSDGLITSYLWGYGGRYLIARLTGVDYNAFSSVLNTTVLAKDLPSDNELFSQFSSLRSWLSNKLCKVETYTHQPLVGVSSISSSSDRIEFYQYDSFGRLRFILDRKKNILKQFCYNYQGQPDNCQLYYNVTLQQTFQKNDCPSGFTGSPYTYTVAAGTHAGTSQLEANNKAQQDLSSHGQNQANIHGTCLPVYYNVAIAEYFYNANCPNSTLDGVWVVIPAGAYSSTVGQAEADQLARAAAQQYANQNGTCSQSGFPLYGSNNTGSSMTLLLRNTQTQTSYYFFLGAYQGWSQLGTVPPGNYDIELISDGYNSFNYSIGCGFWGSAAGYASLYNVYLDGSCANIEITF